MRLLARSRLLPLNNDGLFDAFKIAHRYVDVWIFLLEILPCLNRKLTVAIVGPGPAVDGDLPAGASILFHPKRPARFIVSYRRRVSSSR
jgi:hypothetical protein